MTHLTTQKFKSHGDHLIVVLVFCNAMIFIELRKNRKDMASSRQVFNNQHQNGTTVLHTGLAQLWHSNPIRFWQNSLIKIYFCSDPKQFEQVQTNLDQSKIVLKHTVILEYFNIKE